MYRTTLVLVLLAACGGNSSTPSDASTGADAGCTCNEPPAAVCLDNQTLEGYSEPGTCNADGTCTYETFSTVCPFACADGACQPEACTPSCSSTACVGDGCGGACGPCPSGTTFPGLTATQLGIAEDFKASPDGIHLAAIRGYDPIPTPCQNVYERRGKLDVWTVPASGAATHRTIANGVAMSSLKYAGDRMVFTANGSACEYVAELWVAKPDGSDPRRIATKAAFPEVVGGRVFWSEGGNYYAAVLPTGAPVLLGPAQIFREVSPTGTAMWVEDLDSRTLTIYRVDGTSTRVADAPDGSLSIPRWSPDGSKLAFTTNAPQIPFQTLYVIDADGTDRVMLDNECRCGSGATIAWSHDSARIAWTERPPTFGLDVHVHAFTGGPDVVLTGVISPTTGGTVERFEFSVDDSRILASAGSDQNGWKVMAGSPTTPGAMTSLLDGLNIGGFQYGTDWHETPDGKVLAAFGGVTHVITYGGGTQVISGIPGGSQLEDAADPRWLFHISSSLGVYSKTGAMLDAPLPGYMRTTFLDDWARSQRIPFVFGWAGATLLYPSDVIGTSKVAQDLMAKAGTTSGRIGDAVTHYRLTPSPARIYFTAGGGSGLFWVPRP
jgi:hypothetical protein